METQVAADQSNRQMQVTKAGQPPPPPPDPQMQAEMTALLQAAGPAIIQLAKIMQTDPMLTKGNLKDQVSAAKTIVDTTVDAGKLMAGGK